GATSSGVASLTRRGRIRLFDQSNCALDRNSSACTVAADLLLERRHHERLDPAAQARVAAHARSRRSVGGRGCRTLIPMAASEPRSQKKALCLTHRNKKSERISKTA